MSELILHHYELSPYSEKIRAIFGYKKLAWRSVITPPLMPKQDLVALTGGYRKAPVLQQGRDIYCDTRLIVRLLDRLQPEPPLQPAALKASCRAFTSLEPTLFFATVPVVFQPAGLKALTEELGAEVMLKFSEDRKLLFTGGGAQRPNAAFSKLNFLPLFNAIDVQLADSPYLLGDTPTLADFICYHCAWFILRNSGVAGSFDPFRNLLAWATRMRALGHGQPSPMTGEQTLQTARACTQDQPFDGPLVEPEGLKLGQRVRINATDYGCDPVTGTLVHASVFELALKRSDERAGEVIVHFPREDFRVSAAE
jgi:glutathione S-transferase